MWIKTQVVLCCILATTLASNEQRLKKKDDPRNKRTLEYSISHNHNAGSNYKIERRISNGSPISQGPQYPLFYPVQKPFTVFKKGRLNVSAPPYAVQMEPLVHYSQRDPLYDASALPGGITNDVKGKDDLQREHSHNSRISYGYPPVKHVIERPVYIKEPEPIIEIIIKESNITLPPLPIPPISVPPRKKEQVQVFYVKYKKNPNGYGKESIVYDKPVPALSPHVPDEPELVQPPISSYESIHTATVSPLPSTTLRAIVKPDSESYHADKGIHITFGKTVNEQYKRSHTDDVKEESAPQPAVSHQYNPSLQPQPQGRQFNPFPTQTFFPNRQSSNVNVEKSQFSNQVKNENERLKNSFQNSQPTLTLKQHQPLQFNRDFTINNGQGISTKPPGFPNQAFLPRSTPPQQFSSTQFNNPPRQAVPYQPFDQFRHQQQPQFTRTHTHFPINQQNSQVNHQFSHNHFQQAQANNQQFQNFQKQSSNIPAFQPLSQQHLHQPQFSYHFNQQQSNNQFSVQQQQQQRNAAPQQHVHQQSTQTESSELIQSLPRYEQHISTPTQSQPQNFAQQHSQPQNSQQQHLQQQQSQLQHSQQHLQQQHSQQSLQQQYTQHLSQLHNPQHLHQLQPQQQKHLPQLQHFQQLQQQPQLPQNFNKNQQEFSLLSQSQFKQNLNNPVSQIHKTNVFQQSTFQTTSKPVTTAYKPQSPTTTTTPPSTTEGKLTEEDLKALNIQLPDEVPDDLREQLLSSGILKGAQISILDYDKIGDTSIADLPPDQLANFFSAGGGQQIAAGSENKKIVVKTNGELVSDKSTFSSTDMEESESALDEIKVPAPVEMKVVRYDPKSDEGQKVPDSYIKEGATQVDPVSLDDQQYNRYLPVKVNGAAFPIPDVPELKGRSITSVVVLAPVDLGMQENQRKARDVNNNRKFGRQLAADALKTLISNPSKENFKDWLDKENKTVIDKQAVVLLVTGDSQKPSNEKEIFMYDLATQTVSKLSGELSSAFVDAAETNSQQNLAPLQPASSNVVETRIPYPHGAVEKQTFYVNDDLEEGASEYVNANVPVFDPVESDSFSEPSEQLESFVDISGMPVQEDLLAAASNLDIAADKISITSRNSKTGSS
ncbi:hypothetical protein RN001_001752 [Aquatica leii]|uniref:Uncharacterized protein n=1 Tax=Aquatica leii TaxID=1421715 RepID=A0AAN7SCW4_9COLE|nr:hypothetical protein RN001_001752 [Aquatica leii]